MDAIASLITSHTIVYSTVYSDEVQRKHQSSASLAFVWGIHRGPVNSLHKWPVTRKCFHVMTSSWTHKRRPYITHTVDSWGVFSDFWKKGCREISRVYCIITKHVMNAIMKISKINLDYKLTYWAAAWRILPVLYTVTSVLKFPKVMALFISTGS